MKKILFLLIPIIVFIACKKEPVIAPSFKNEIIGTWHLHEINTTIIDGQTNSYEDDYTFIATNESIYTLIRPGQPDLIYTWSLSPNENTFFSMYQSQYDPTYYYITAFEVLSHSSTSLHFSRTHPFSAVSPTTGQTVIGTSIRDWVFTK